MCILSFQSKEDTERRSPILTNVNHKRGDATVAAVKDTQTVSQTSLETLARLFPSTKLSVLQLVLQRCGQDLLKAIEYFASDTAIGSSKSSAFRPLQSTSLTETRTTADYPGVFPLPPIYSSLPRNLYGDSGYCLLNIVPDNLTGFPGSKTTISHEQDNNVAFNVQYNNYFNSNRNGLLNLPPVIPGIPCVQPNCTQCYKFI